MYNTLNYLSITLFVIISAKLIFKKKSVSEASRTKEIVSEASRTKEIVSKASRTKNLNKTNQLAKQVDKNNQLYSLNIDKIKKITKKISISRQIDTLNLNKVKNYIMSLLNNKMDTIEQKFTQILHKRLYNLSNIIAYNKYSNSSEYILLSAHIDSYKNIECALDSATSIAIIINIANKILQINPSFPLMIVFFDGEESIDDKWTRNDSLLGSQYFVNTLTSLLEQIDINKSTLDKSTLDKSTIKIAYILDLIGGDLTKTISAFSNNPSANNIINHMHMINKNYENELFISTKKYISERIVYDDHLPFQEQNINYVHLIPYNFPNNHHKIEDNYENLNWKYIEIFTNVLFNHLII